MSEDSPRSDASSRSAGGATSRRGAALVFALSLSARLAVVAWAASRIPPVADGAFYHTIATRIAQGLGYTWLWPDGAITYAGHYPVGYPAMVGAAYFLAGPHPPAAMFVNALLGSLAATAAYVLAGRAGDRRSALVAGVLVALHPGLLAYTPAMMTEGVTAALVACAAWAAVARIGGGKRVILAGVILGIATLVRPQSLVLAPIFGWLAERGGEALTRRRALVRGAGAAVVAGVVALAVCAPWTIRNCARMKRCSLVSYNGGWNLLIGADAASTGTWAEIKVPVECREVFDEAEKDVCFGVAARRYIAEHPAAWLSLVPRKLAATFDYAGAGGWYLHAANPDAFPDRAKLTAGAVETVFERVTLLLALLAAAASSWRLVRDHRRARQVAPLGGSGRRIGRLVAAGLVLVLVAIGLVFSVMQHAWVAYVALGAALLAGAMARERPEDEPLLPAASAAVLLSLALTHAVFFGAGRYSLVAFPFVTAVAALGFARRRMSVDGGRGGEPEASVPGRAAK